MSYGEPFRAHLALNSCPLSWVNTKNMLTPNNSPTVRKGITCKNRVGCWEVDLIFEIVVCTREEHDDHEGQGNIVTSIDSSRRFLSLFEPYLPLDKERIPSPPSNNRRTLLWVYRITLLKGHVYRETPFYGIYPPTQHTLSS